MAQNPQKGIILHTFGVQVGFSRNEVPVGRRKGLQGFRALRFRL